MLTAYFAALGEKPYRAVQLMKWIYHRGLTDFAEMTDLSKALRDKLLNQAVIEAPAIRHQQVSQDGSHKWLLHIDHSNGIETVFIPETDRGTLCVSSQVGCSLNCAFCATAQQGFNRNLSTAEIIGQVWQTHHQLGGGQAGSRRITNVVLMGMGEPLMNLTQVIPAVNLMQDDWGYGLSKRRITLSTAGVVPALYKLRDLTDVSVAVSLHAPDDALRNELVPINRHYPLAELLSACRYYIADKPHRSITFEYVMLAGVNDSPNLARALARLLQGMPAKVNLIPFNTFPNTSYRCSPWPVIERFQKHLMEQGLTAIIRRPRGDDIAAACGQLAGHVQDRRRMTRPERLLHPASPPTIRL